MGDVIERRDVAEADHSMQECGGGAWPSRSHFGGWMERGRRIPWEHLYNNMCIVINFYGWAVMFENNIVNLLARMWRANCTSDVCWAVNQRPLDREIIFTDFADPSKHDKSNSGNITSMNTNLIQRVGYRCWGRPYAQASHCRCIRHEHGTERRRTRKGNTAIDHLH